MAAVRSMLSRVRRLEQGKASASPFLRFYGSLADFEAGLNAAMDAGTLDRPDVSVVIASIRLWHREDMWDTPWH